MDGTQGHSLKGRLLAFLLAAVLLVTLMLAATSYRGALREADAMFDHYLQQTANSLRGAAPLGIAPEAFDSGDGFELYIQIWGPDGVQLYRSARSALPPRAVLGFSDVRVEGSRYRVYSVQNRFQTAIDHITTTSTNLASAQSRIQDADYAKEVSSMTRAQILQQAGTSVLAQANQTPQSVLKLLG